MATPAATSTDKQLLTRAQMRPVWDENGNLIGISELEVATDRRLGIQAMKDLIATTEANDDILCADGWTLKQKRIVATKAPNACHYLKTAKRWDTTSGTMVPKVTILLPTEVVWAMFDMLFDGQYSVKVVELTSTDEEIMPNGERYRDIEPDNMPGRRFYTNARVQLTIHLANGKERTYEGFGVAFGDIPMHKIGNIAAINNEQRTTEKGAIADAKREALSNIGQVFRRAFEDGDEMIKTIEGMLLADLQERNRPRIQVVAGRTTVPAPASRKPQAQITANPNQEKSAHTHPASIKEDDLDAVFGPPIGVKSEKSDTQAQSAEADAKVKSIKPIEQEKVPAEPASVDEGTQTQPSEGEVYFIVAPDGEKFEVDAATCEETFINIATSACETSEEFSSFMEKNDSTLTKLVADRTEIVNLKAEFFEDEVEAVADGIPDFDTDGSDESDVETDGPSDDDLTIAPDKKSGKTILTEFLAFFDAAKSPRELDRVIEMNGPAIRKMTSKQMQTMADRKSDALKRLRN